MRSSRKISSFQKKCWLCWSKIFIPAAERMKFTKNVNSNRNKRALLFPEASTMGIFIAIAVPIDLADRNVFMSYNFEANYNLPWEGWHYLPGPLKRFYDFKGTHTARSNSNENSLETNNTVENKERKRRFSLNKLFSRKTCFRVLEEKFSRYGYKGRSCLLRFICEVNSSRIGENNGILGHLLHVILSPSTSKNENLDEDYYMAERNGLQGNCTQYKVSCPKSILKKISETLV